MPDKRSIPRICQQCGKDFLARKQDTGKFCSRACTHESMRRNGGRTLRDGYVFMTLVPGLRVLEHRHVMEQHLGRPLRSDEHVHHIDGNRLNNAIANLQVMSNSEHVALHRRMRQEGGRWATHWGFCQWCGTTERRHIARGFCTRCYHYWHESTH